MSITRRHAQRRIPVPPETVFALLADPSRHPGTDASGTVTGAVSTEPLRAVGQVFAMEMVYAWADGHEDRYRTDNHVDVLEPGRAIGWRTATVGGAPLGWAWRYHLEPVVDGCDVTLVYDWTDTSAENLERYGVPAFSTADLAASLERLEVSVTHPA